MDKTEPAHADALRSVVSHVSERGFVRRDQGATAHLTVACIMDEFSYQSFSPEADFVPLTPDHWLIELSVSQPDLLIVESAWRGHKGSWWNTVHRFGAELRGILAWCKDRGIPTAFWNKEDPVHFPTFLNTASGFDVVFTTDMDCVPRYKERLGHERAYFLPFAAQPLLHNPIASYDRIEGCAFAGAYYRKYPERTADLDELSETLMERSHFDIYDRNFGLEHPDYMFPKHFEKNIVGTLKPSQVSAAYKGYTMNLNLNSVKQSQSMFARRVFELLASNTLVVSNFARGLRIMFGDLTICTDDGQEMRRRLDELETLPYGVERLRTLGLRKVMTEHTYAERLAFVADACGIRLDKRESAAVLAVAVVSGHEDVARVVEAVIRQSLPDVDLVLVGPPDTETRAAAGSHRYLTMEESWRIPDLCYELGAQHIAFFSPTDHYGTGYLADAVLALGWAHTSAVGRGRYFHRVEQGAEITGATTSFAFGVEMPLRRCLVEGDALVDLWKTVPVEEWLDFEVSGLAIDPFNYCLGGADLPSDVLEGLDDLPVTDGTHLNLMREHADTAVRVGGDEAASVDLRTMFEAMPSVSGPLSISRDGDGYRVESSLDEGVHRYIYSTQTVGLEVLPPAEKPIVYFECDPGADVTLALIFLSADGERLGHVMVSQMRNSEVVAPEGTSAVRVGLRVAGPGATTIRRYVTDEFHELSTGVVPTSRTLVLTNVYPSYKRLYRNAFVHTRVLGYRTEGERVDVAITGAGARSSYREFQDVDISEMTSDLLQTTLQGGELDSLLVHFLDESMWDAIRECSELKNVYVWIHGAEVQPWWRRQYNYVDEESLALAKVASERRIIFWRQIFSDLPENVHFVFVSQYLAEEVFEDLQVRLPDDRYSIIHNPIDTTTFAYTPKPPEQRKRVLSIRTYASRKYANDLSVEAVRLLSHRDGFEDLEFLFVGDGELFDETLAPIRDLPNVAIRREFLTQSQMAELHQSYGVFLTPTRWDSQGVSRDEAMASGLVPLTTAVAAVPEFVDESCAYLTPPEDAASLAEAIWELAHDGERFESMSEAAAQRVRQQTAADIVIPRELALIREGPSALT